MTSPTLVRLTRGVHRAPHEIGDARSVAAALLTACPPGSVVAGYTAASIHRLWLPAPVGAGFEVNLRGAVPKPEAHAGGRRPEIIGHRRRLHADDVTQLDGVAITSLSRTWFDLAAQLSLPDLVAAGDCALRAGCTLSDIDRVITRSRHSPGIVRARSARDLLDARSRSRPESHLRVALVTGGLPRPAVNEPVCSEHGEWLFEPDLAYAQARLALEYNGADHADRARMRRDMTRAFDGYARGGWLVLSLGPAEVFRRPDQTVAVVARLLRERTGH